jgi:hypothetical protein
VIIKNKRPIWNSKLKAGRETMQLALITLFKTLSPTVGLFGGSCRFLPILWFIKGFYTSRPAGNRLNFIAGQGLGQPALWKLQS